MPAKKTTVKKKVKSKKSVSKATTSKKSKTPSKRVTKEETPKVKKATANKKTSVKSKVETAKKVAPKKKATTSKKAVDKPKVSKKVTETKKVVTKKEVTNKKRVEKMKYCKNCDRTFEEAFTFCPMCTSRLLSELEVQKLNEEIDAKLKAEEKRKKEEKEEAIAREKAIKELEKTYYKVLPFYEILKKVNADHLTKFYNLFGRDGYRFPLYQIIDDWYQHFSKNDFDESEHLKRLVNVYPLKLAGPSAIRVETLETIIADVLKLVDPTTSISDIKQILLEKAKPLSTPFDEKTILKKWSELHHALNPRNPNINSEFYGEYIRTITDLSFLNAYIRGGTVSIISSIEQERNGSWIRAVPYERTYTNTYTSTTLKYNCSLQTLIAKKVNAPLRSEKDHLEIVKLYLEMDFAILLHRKITIISKNATTPFGLHDYLCGKLIEIDGFATYGTYKRDSSGHSTACISSCALLFSADKIDSKTYQTYSSF